MSTKPVAGLVRPRPAPARLLRRLQATEEEPQGRHTLRVPKPRVLRQAIRIPTSSTHIQRSSKLRNVVSQEDTKASPHTVSYLLDLNMFSLQLLNLPGVQHTVNGDGGIEPYLNSTGQPVTIYLNETEPSTVSPISDRSTLFERLEERDRYLSEREMDSSCGCVWLST